MADNESKHRASEAFYNELQALVDRFSQEWDMPFSAAIGVVEIFKNDLVNEQRFSLLEDVPPDEEEET